MKLKKAVFFLLIVLIFSLILPNFNRVEASERNSQDWKMIMEKIYGFDFNDTLSENIKKINNEDTKTVKIKTGVLKDDGVKNISFSYNDEQDKVTKLLILAGLPGSPFDSAVKLYSDYVGKPSGEHIYLLNGSYTSGALAQYAAVMSEGFVRYKVVNYNSYGIKRLLKFRGNEFLGYSIGLLHFVDDKINNNDNCETILNALINKGIIKDGNISMEYRRLAGEGLNIDKLKKALVEVFTEVLDFEEEEIKELVDSNFNYKIVTRKMVLIDRYRDYLEKRESDNEKITNFILSSNIESKILQNIGTTYVVDDNFDTRINSEQENIIQWNKVLNNDLNKNSDDIVEIFTPFILLKEKGNGEMAVNMNGEKPETGEMTNNLSLDYLRSVIKDIILGLKKEDQELVNILYTYHEKGQDELILEIIKDVLRHSIQVRTNKVDSEKYDFKSQYIKDNKEVLEKGSQAYILDKSILDQLNYKLHDSEIYDLWKWETKDNKKYLVLGSTTDKELIVEYLVNYGEWINNKQVRLKKLK
ncbi:MAG: hypothetical protein ACOCRZ_00260 [Halothermotrichaceae bacterium]